MIQMKDLRVVSLEEALLTPDRIDSVFYNLDGSRKTDEEVRINLTTKYPSVQFSGLTKN